MEKEKKYDMRINVSERRIEYNVPNIERRLQSEEEIRHMQWSESFSLFTFST